MVRNDRWLESVDHRARVWALWTLGVLVQRTPGGYVWERRELPGGKLSFTITVDADAYRTVYSEQAAAKGWGERLLRK